MTKSKRPSSKDALDIFRLLKRNFDDGISIRQLAEESGHSERTLYRALNIFRQRGLDGLRRSHRADRGKRRKITSEVEKAIEGLCLQAPKPTIMWVYRQISETCRLKNLSVPSYSVVLDIYHRLDKRLKTLAHDGEKAYQQEFDELIRRESEYPNHMWQCDHKDLKLWAMDHNGRIGKVWITAILDDFSRMVPGYFLAIGAPNSMRIATALRQGIWVKYDESWPVSGIPEIFYSDHGSDFESTHIEQVAADLDMRLVNTLVYEPRGRGKIERFFRTLVQMFCPDHKSSKEKPKLLAEIEAAFREWLNAYHHREHTEIDTTPLQKWSSNAFLPRLPDSLDVLDLMLMKVAKPRMMMRDGIRFDNKRYSHEVLTESIGQQFDVRYDPRDLSHIWVYGEGGNLICNAPLMGVHPSKEQIKETIARRRRIKKRLKNELLDKQQAGDEFVRKSAPEAPIENMIDKPTHAKRRLRKHFHERR